MQETQTHPLLVDYLQTVIEVLNEDNPENEFLNLIESSRVNWQELAKLSVILGYIVPVQELLAVIEAQFKTDVEDLSTNTRAHLNWAHSKDTKQLILDGKYHEEVAPKVADFQRLQEVHSLKLNSLNNIRQNLTVA